MVYLHIEAFDNGRDSRSGKTETGRRGRGESHSPSTGAGDKEYRPTPMLKPL